GLQQLRELVDHFLGRVARRHHDPNHPRRPQLLDEVLERARARGAVLHRLLDPGLGASERDHLVPGVAANTLDHVAAHPAHPYEADLRHSISLMVAVNARSAPAGLSAKAGLSAAGVWAAGGGGAPPPPPALRARRPRRAA